MTLKPLTGSHRVPGDKSISHRALLFSALAEGRSVISGLSMGGDALSTRSCLEAMGVIVRSVGETLEVTGAGL
ncbi:MAG: 3-phosphoshikimate 1-carboxyvinyltransferase, partial [Bacteroidetes bacterium]|nr:3-phosphoshikimate 1-carboxyvinyltransferase [Bacteroidota bacterium]